MTVLLESIEYTTQYTNHLTGIISLQYAFNFVYHVEIINIFTIEYIYHNYIVSGVKEIRKKVQDGVPLKSH